MKRFQLKEMISLGRSEYVHESEWNEVGSQTAERMS